MLEYNHVYCMEANELLGKLPDESVDMILCDPPFGVNWKSNRNTYFDQIAGDKQLPVDWLAHAYRVLKSGSAIYIYSHWRTFGDLKNAVEDVGFAVKNMVVLRKSNHGMGDIKGGYSPKHELVLFAVKGRHLLNKTPPAYKRLPDVIDVPVIYSRKHRHHSCEKPISWHLPFIQSSSRAGDLVVDPFCGSGSVPLACVETGRNYLAGDIDEGCVDVSRSRLGVNQLMDNNFCKQLESA